jgi:hypothetical protein
LGNYTVAMRNHKTCATWWLVLCSVLILLFGAGHCAAQRYRGLQAGDALPRARLQTSHDAWIDTESWRGTPTLLVVIHPGCAACAREIEGLAAIADTIPNLKVVLFSVRSEIRGLPMPFLLVADPDGAFHSKVRKLVTPVLYWVNAAGEVRYARAGWRPAVDEQKILLALMEREGRR